MSSSAKGQICITPRHRGQCVDGQRERGQGRGVGWRQAKGAEMGTSGIVLIKIKEN